MISEHVGLLVVFGGPGGRKQIREACRKNFHNFSSKSELMVPSYDHLSEKMIFKHLNILVFSYFFRSGAFLASF